MFWVVLLTCVLIGALQFADEPAVAVDSGSDDSGGGDTAPTDAEFGVSPQDAAMDELAVEDIPDESAASAGPSDDSDADETSGADDNVTQTAQESGFDPSLVDYARRYYQMTDEEIARYGSSERLHAALDGMYQQQVRRTTPNADQSKLDEKESALKVLLESEGDDAFDDRLVDQVRMMVDEINSLKTQVAEGTQQFAVAQQQQVAQHLAAAEVQMDGFIDEVSDDFPGYFGKGLTANMAPNSRERSNRVALFNRALGLAAVLQGQPGGLPSEKEILTQAAYSLFGSKLGNGPVRNNGRSQHVNRPTNRQSKAETQDAAAFADQFMREKGFDPGDYDDDIGL